MKISEKVDPMPLSLMSLLTSLLRKHWLSVQGTKKAKSVTVLIKGIVIIVLHFSSPPSHPHLKRYILYLKQTYSQNITSNLVTFNIMSLITLIGDRLFSVDFI